jgi:hypothetical protein
VSFLGLTKVEWVFAWHSGFLLCWRVEIMQRDRLVA